MRGCTIDDLSCPNRVHTRFSTFRNFPWDSRLFGTTSQSIWRPLQKCLCGSLWSVLRDPAPEGLILLNLDILGESQYGNQNQGINEVSNCNAHYKRSGRLDPRASMSTQCAPASSQNPKGSWQQLVATGSLHLRHFVIWPEVNTGGISRARAGHKPAVSRAVYTRT
jgi:hypothetical protein